MIEVRLEYRDDKRHILRGVYADDAPELEGLANHLLRAGHAVYIMEISPATEATPVSDDNNEQIETPKQESPSRNRRNRK